MASVIAVNPDVEQRILTGLGGITNFVPHTMSIDLVNTLGPTTTVQYTATIEVPSDPLLEVIGAASAEARAALNTASAPTSTTNAS